MQELLERTREPEHRMDAEEGEHADEQEVHRPEGEEKKGRAFPVLGRCVHAVAREVPAAFFMTLAASRGNVRL